MRLGRGPGSGVGKSAGRGMCGQRHREGGRRTNTFEVLYNPIYTLQNDHSSVDLLVNMGVKTGRGICGQRHRGRRTNTFEVLY